MMKFNKPDRDYNKLNDFLRGEMRRKKVNQARVGEYLHIPQTAVSNRLSGKTEWTLREIMKIYELLGVEHEWNS